MVPRDYCCMPTPEPNENCQAAERMADEASRYHLCTNETYLTSSQARGTTFFLALVIAHALTASSFTVRIDPVTGTFPIGPTTTAKPKRGATRGFHNVLAVCKPENFACCV